MRFRILASILSLAFAGIASATPIKFTYTGTGSGDLGGSAFSNAAFTISALGDTDARQSFSNGYFIDQLNASIDIAGVGSVAFITATRTFVNNLAGIVGFSRAGTSGLDLYNGPFEYGINWDMLSDLGPITGTFGLFQWDQGAVDTSGGILAFTSSTGGGTFTAALARDVPEPSALWLMLGVLFVAALMLRRSIKPASRADLPSRL